MYEYVSTNSKHKSMLHNYILSVGYIKQTILVLTLLTNLAIYLLNNNFDSKFI